MDYKNEESETAKKIQEILKKQKARELEKKRPSSPQKELNQTKKHNLVKQDPERQKTVAKQRPSSPTKAENAQKPKTTTKVTSP